MLFKRRSTLNDSTETRAGLESRTGPTAEVHPAVAATTTTDPGLSLVVDAARRIASLRDTNDIYRAAVTEAVALTSAEVGAFVVVDLRGAEVEARFGFQSHPQLFTATDLSGPCLTAAIADRRSICEVIGDEPSLAVNPTAVAAVPAIARGEVLGLIMVIRGADEPFGNTELETLELLAPVVGSALGNANPAMHADIDDVTHLANRRRMDRDIIDLTREGKVGVASIKIDRFATLMSEQGPGAGDELLRQIALTVSANVRPDDVAYRTGDAEFVVLLPGADKKETAWVAERVRQAITAVAIAGLGTIEHPSASIGVTAGDRDDPQELTERARAAMLEAEELGANQVVLDEAV